MKDDCSKDIKSMFSNLCCSRCKNDFSQESINIKKKDCETLICTLSCAECGKDFGDIVLNYNYRSKSHLPLEIIDGPPPISIDDVINAHEFIKKI
ncbi:hypothetical protein J6G99_02165 [bacterium]|nr:hypothetical protein [bacterium]